MSDIIRICGNRENAAAEIKRLRVGLADMSEQNDRANRRAERAEAEVERLKEWKYKVLDAASAAIFDELMRAASDRTDQLLKDARCVNVARKKQFFVTSV